MQCRFSQGGQGLYEPLISLVRLFYLALGPCQSVFQLAQGVCCHPLTARVSLLLIDDDDKEAAKQPQGDHVGPKIAILDAFSEQKLAVLIKTLAVVPVRGINPLQRKIQEALPRFRRPAIGCGIVRRPGALSPT
jgi:hypothetical protein